MQERPLVAVVGYVPQKFREYALLGAHSVADLWLLTPSAETWHREYCTRISEVDLDDDKALDTLTSLLTGNVAGVFTLDERYVELTARLVSDLGLPGSSPAAVRSLKDKAALRELTAGRPYAARFAVAQTVQDAGRIANGFGYPVVLKPRSLGGSIGVVKVESPSDLEDAFHLADDAKVGELASAHHGVLIEEYLSGPEISVDASVSDGVTQVHFIADKLLGPEPYFEEFGHIIPSRYEEHHDSIVAAVRDIHELSRFDNGVSHVELRLSADGPRLIEANARLGGDLIPYLGFLATGVDLARIAAEIAIGVKPTVPPARPGAASVRFLYPDAPMTLARIDWGEPDAYGEVRLERHQFAPEGSRIAPPPDAFLSRAGYVLGHGDDRDTTAKAVANAADTANLLNEHV